MIEVGDRFKWLAQFNGSTWVIGTVESIQDGLVTLRTDDGEKWLNVPWNALRASDD